MNWKEQFTKETGDYRKFPSIDHIDYEFIAGQWYERFTLWLESKLTKKTEQLTEILKRYDDVLKENSTLEADNLKLESQLKEASEENKKLFEASQPSLYKQLKEERQKREEAEAKLKAIEDSLLSDDEIEKEAKKYSGLSSSGSNWNPSSTFKDGALLMIHLINQKL